MIVLRAMKTKFEMSSHSEIVERVSDIKKL